MRGEQECPFLGVPISTNPAPSRFLALKALWLHPGLQGRIAWAEWEQQAHECEELWPLAPATIWPDFFYCQDKLKICIILLILKYLNSLQDSSLKPCAFIKMTANSYIKLYRCQGYSLSTYITSFHPPSNHLSPIFISIF